MKKGRPPHFLQALGNITNNFIEHKLLKLTKVETENMNSSLYLLKILNSSTKNFPTKETPGPEMFSINFYETYKKKQHQSYTN